MEADLAWPILVQWDDGQLQVIHLHEWIGDPDLSLWPGQYLFICDSSGRILSQREPPKGRWWQNRKPMIFETTNRYTDDRRVEELVARDYRMTPEERTSLLAPGERLARLFRHVRARSD